MAAGDFQAQVQAKIAKLRQGSLRKVEADLCEKRARWAREQLTTRSLPATPRAAFELFIRDYLGADLADVPVIRETEAEIVWRAVNPCDTLEACQHLGLETRQVCRALYEKPVQVLVSELDPQLRFVRNYARIRPDAPDCEESFVRVDFGRCMDLALEEAQKSLVEGNKGYGAVVTRGREVLARAHDTAVTEKDPSLHAELKAIRQAVIQTGDTNLSGCVLLSTCEPCPMCAGLAVWANVTTIVYGASIGDTMALGRSRINVPVHEIVDRAPVSVEVIGGVRQKDCLELYGGSGD